jgi:hypothetical protein
VISCLPVDVPNTGSSCDSIKIVAEQLMVAAGKGSMNGCWTYRNYSFNIEDLGVFILSRRDDPRCSEVPRWIVFEGQLMLKSGQLRLLSWETEGSTSLCLGGCGKGQMEGQRKKYQ